MVDINNPITPMSVETGSDVIMVIPKNVIVVDDELVGPKYAHLDSASIAFLEDINSPEFAELLKIAGYIEGFSDIEKEGTTKIREYFASDKLIEVILSQHFSNHSTDVLKVPLANFLSQAERIRKLRGHLEAAFSKPQFDLKFCETRPNIKELLACDLLVLDLVLEKSVSPVDEAVKYLKLLGIEAALEALPPIILMSSHQELIEHKKKFSTESNISAAGLLVLTKKEVAAEGFAAQGLHLTYQQLSIQHKVASKMRAFILTWTKALEEAREKAATTLWNLDAAAMQQIHLTAFKDNDPYDEHLNELIAREYMWHVESNPSVGSTIDELDKCFKEQFDAATPPSIQHRFIAPFVEPENSRILLSHFTWTGWKLPAPFIGLNESTAISEFNKLVPFGALLVGNDFKPNAECLIHITQQCDLNSASRDPADKQTSVFAVVQAVEVEPHKIPNHSSQDLVARSLHVDGKEYDFKLLKGRLLALPIAEFLKYASDAGLRVHGRLRHDIATHFMQATVNHLTRPASQAMVRIGVTDAKLYLRGGKFKNGQCEFLDFPTTEEKIVQITREGTVYNFQNDESIRIALWIQEKLKKNYEIEDFDVSALCSVLRVRCRDRQPLVGIVDFRVLNGDLDNALNAVKSMQDPKPKVNLVVVTER